MRCQATAEPQSIPARSAALCTCLSDSELALQQYAKLVHCLSALADDAACSAPTLSWVQHWDVHRAAVFPCPYLGSSTYSGGDDGQTHRICILHLAPAGVWQCGEGLPLLTMCIVQQSKASSSHGPGRGVPQTPLTVHSAAKPVHNEACALCIAAWLRKRTAAFGTSSLSTTC